MRCFALLFPILLLAGCAGSPDYSAPAADPLVTTMVQRLEISREVAWIKYSNNLPVRDPQREVEVIDRMSTLAQSRGMSPGRVRMFFAAQIAASCAEQEKLIRAWKRGAPAPSYPPRDLRAQVRADIDRINLAMLAALDRPPANGLRRQAEETLRASGAGKEAVRLAVAPL